MQHPPPKDSTPGAEPIREVRSSDACPPTPAHIEDLGFEPYQPMVEWFSPTELVRAGVKATLSSLFGAYADQREMQALQGAPEVYDYTQDGPLWIDYVADLGDGFDATYTVARLLAEETLTLEEGHETRRGRLLVMGGDQVYPAATRETYNDRLVGPYRAALPCVLPADAAPHLFAVPGNHDWYDGLTSFTRLFCQQRWIGGWKTRQTRSYFAARLSCRWWLWGIDVQLHSDIDLPQLEYFKTVARERMDRDSLIILCSAEPAWVAAARDDEAYDVLAFFEKETMAPHGHSLAVGLAGDLHTYARYEQETPEQPSAPKQRFISGGGGAYLYPTHDLPRRLALPDPSSSNGKETYSLENREDRGGDTCSVFPGIPESRRLTWGNALFGWWNWKLSLFFGGFYLFFAWVFWTALATTFLKSPAASGLDYGAFFSSLVHSPASTLLLVVLWGSLIGYADARRFARFALGTFHVLLHILLLPFLMWGFFWLSQAVPGESIWVVMGFSIVMLVLVVFGGGTIMGGYLLVSNRLWGVHSNEVLLGQRLTSYKNFLRLHLDAHENLTIYPVGIREMCKDWKLNPEAPRGTAWFSSQTWDRRYDAEPEKRRKLYTLIEGPIRIIAQAGRESRDTSEAPETQTPPVPRTPTGAGGVS